MLVVDDDPDIRRALMESLDDHGYEACCVTNGREALEFLRTHPAPRVILLDLMMPVMDGFQFRVEQQEDTRLARIPVVVISAGGNCQEAATAMGATSCLRKPFRLDELLAALDALTAELSEP